MSNLNLAYRFEKLKALALLVLGQNRAAENQYSAMLARWPDDAHSLESRSHLLATRGEPALAIADLRVLLEREPGHGAAAWFNLGFLLDAQGDLQASHDALRRAVELDPKLDRAWYGLGLALMKLERHEEAIAALKRNTELQPMSPYGWTQLVRVHMNRQEAEEARRIIAHLRGFEPKVAAALARETGLQA